AGSVQTFSTNTSEFLYLREVNKSLASENAQLRQELIHYMTRDHIVDTAQLDFLYIPSKVVNNSFQRSINFFTLNKGTNDGILPGMGVVSAKGITGVVKSVSGNFSTVTSLLHQNLMVSSQLKSTHTLCTTQWDGASPLESNVRFIPRHIPLALGDSVVTSGFNSIFPEGMLIGTVSSYELPDESPYYMARIRLANDFTSLRYVFVIANRMKSEKDSLEALYE
ncbi:MAG: rod shape-determining protein MreC, partial [Cyclobacteriaceae bacterium]|nr:rod shape-determining protein MreC [Cyclobacteriaceae bacterium]